MEPPRVSLVASGTSGVDGSSEGGRISTTRLAYTLVIYSVPLLNQLRRDGYRGALNAEPVQVDGTWCLRVTYEEERPRGVPDRWHGHRVILQRAKPHA